MENPNARFLPLHSVVVSRNPRLHFLASVPRSIIPAQHEHSFLLERQLLSHQFSILDSHFADWALFDKPQPHGIGLRSRLLRRTKEHAIAGNHFLSFVRCKEPGALVPEEDVPFEQRNERLAPLLGSTRLHPKIPRSNRYEVW